MNCIERAAQEVGGMRALADALKVTHEAVRLWKQAGRAPAKRVLQIEALTKGKVTRHELNPDIYPQDSVAASA